MHGGAEIIRNERLQSAREPDLNPNKLFSYLRRRQGIGSEHMHGGVLIQLTRWRISRSCRTLWRWRTQPRFLSRDTLAPAYKKVPP